MSGQSAGGGGTGATTITQIIAPGLLIAASVYTDDDLEQPYETWAAIHLMRGGTEKSQRIHMLTDGFITEDHPLSWHGLFITQPDDFIQVALRGNLDPVFRFQFQRITATNVGPLKEVFDVLNRPD
jgi:hypothetical protein